MPSVAPDVIVQAYKDMLLLRRFEEKAGQLYGMRLICGFCHLYIGQEAVAVGMKRALSPNDTFITSYREHGFAILANYDCRAVMAELLGKSTGASKGKGGSMHIFDVKNGMYGGHGIVGAQVPLGTGLGFSFKYRSQPHISTTIFGDGAANQGQVYESFNMAKLWKLPVLYVIENNEYAMGTSVARASCTTDLYRRGQSFDIPGKEVDGMDFYSVYNATKEAASYIRDGNGPMILEMKTYRYRGHSMSDPAKYRDDAEVQIFKEKDPILKLKPDVLKTLSDRELADAEKEVMARVEDAVQFAKDSKEPEAQELYEDVYSQKHG